MTRIGPYEIERELGRGGSGSVFLARDPNLGGREVAIKVLESPRDGRAERFRREMEALARLRHPNVVSVHANGATPEGRAYIVMDHVAGETLAKRLDAGATLDAALGWLRDAARGIAHAHEKGVVHRDLKPDNVLVVPDGTAVVCDFGIARQIDRATVLTEPGDVLGTLPFLAPELARGETPTPATDVFGLGALLYYIISGAAPYGGDSVFELVRAAEQCAAPPPVSKHGPVPPAIEALRARSMARDPAARPRDGAEFVVELDRAQGRATAAPRPDERPGSPVALIVGALVLFVAGGVAVVVTREAPRVEKPGPPLPPPRSGGGGGGARPSAEVIAARRAAEAFAPLFADATAALMAGDALVKAERARDTLLAALERLELSPHASPAVVEEVLAPVTSVARGFVFADSPFLAPARARSNPLYAPLVRKSRAPPAVLVLAELVSRQERPPPAQLETAARAVERDPALVAAALYWAVRAEDGAEAVRRFDEASALAAKEGVSAAERDGLKMTRADALGALACIEQEVVARSRSTVESWEHVARGVTFASAAAEFGVDFYPEFARARLLVLLEAGAAPRPDHPWVQAVPKGHWLHAEVLRRAGDAAAALRVAASAADREPDAVLVEALALLDLGRPDDARAALRPVHGRLRALSEEARLRLR